ncbi:hypothetical protein ACBP93_08360 [Paenalcaligenes hominis]|uniref:hypothetical protein n=1 Tax=Paenalcaligenes hominis TaxID=643674 RepID=UPI003524BBF9
MTQHVLTDAEMHALICGNPSTLGLSIARLKDFIRQVEKAVVTKLVAEQEPVTEIDCFGDTCCPVFGDRLQLKRGTKLYAHPMPCASQSTDKTACVSGNGKSDRQLARHQPCGCVVCYCENQERCLGCGAKYCGTHEVGEIPNPVYVDHIPDIGQMITPLAQRKIQSLLDKGEYRVIENATVLVNENGHAAIVNKGGAFYWVDNEALAREFDGRAMPVEASLPGPKKKVNLSLTIDTKEAQALLQSYLDDLKGWQLVPKEPTPEMIQASDDSDIEYSKRNFGDSIHLAQSGYDHYKAMLEVAPKYTEGK